MAQEARIREDLLEFDMLPASPPDNEADRLAALRSYGVLDAACEASFDNIVRLASRLTGCPVALVSLVDGERQWFKARHGMEVAPTHCDCAFSAHAILDPFRLLVVPDATKDVRFADNPLVAGKPNIRFYAGVPLVNPEGCALGTLCVVDYHPREVKPEVLDTLAALAQTAMTTVELRRTLMQMRKIALSDQLTGMPNRSAFLAALTKAVARQRRDGQPFSLLYVDLDHFKQVNDQLGHAVGDRVLVVAAEALLSCIRGEDIAARLGGDEFVALLQGGDGQEAVRVGERVCNSIKVRMCAAGWNVTASVGAVAFFQPPASESEALTAADTLMYAAKVDGKDRVVSCAFSTFEQLVADTYAVAPARAHS